MRNKGESLEDFWERHFVEVLFASMLSMLICSLLTVQLVIYGKDNTTFIYLGLCIAEVFLAIMVNKGMLKKFLAELKREYEENEQYN